MDSRLFKGQGTFFCACARAHMRSSSIKIAASLFIFSSGLAQPAKTAPQTFQTAQQNVSNIDLGMSLSAVDFLGRSHDEHATAVLSEAFASEKRMPVRRAICDALGLLHFPSGRATLIAALQDPEPQVRQSAVVALELVGGKES